MCARELMSPPSLIPEPDRTRSRIMKEAVRLFALSGYHTVSIREIAAASGIKPGSVYVHFESKQEIMENIMKFTEEGLRDFYAMLDRLSEKAVTFSELIDNIFLECKEMVNPEAFYGFYCAMTNQFDLECCRHVYYDVYFKDGHMTIRRQLATAIRRGLVDPFDIAETAAAITNSFVTMISFSVGRINGYYEDFDPALWYDRQISHVLRSAGALKV